MKVFARYNNRWMLVVSTTDSTYTTVRYVGIFTTEGAATSRIVLPFTAWSD